MLTRWEMVLYMREMVSSRWEMVLCRREMVPRRWEMVSRRWEMVLCSVVPVPSARYPNNQQSTGNSQRITDNGIRFMN